MQAVYHVDVPGMAPLTSGVLHGAGDMCRGGQTTMKCGGLVPLYFTHTHPNLQVETPARQYTRTSVAGQTWLLTDLRYTARNHGTSAAAAAAPHGARA